MNTMRLVFSLLVAGITASSVQADVYGPYIKDADLTDDHVTTGECGWSMHQTPWNKGHGTFPYQGKFWCRGTTRKGRGQTIEGEAVGNPTIPSILNCRMMTLRNPPLSDTNAPHKP